MKIVALAGGTGAAKLLRGLTRVVDPATLTIVGNTGDNLEMWGLHVSPDLDTVTYTLAGLVDQAKGWGVSGDTFECRARMAALGRSTFFALGDRDLAIHLHRTERLRAGAPLSRVTDEVSSALGVKARILPMSDDPVRTSVLTPNGWVTFQEFFVRDHCEPNVLDVTYDGASEARPAPGVLESLRDADLVIVCPSNPVSSVGPILAVPGVRGALVESRAHVVAVSPIIGDRPVSGPAGKMMRAKGFDVSPAGVADAYEDLVDTLAIHPSDAACAELLRARGIAPLVTDIMMDTPEKEIALARVVMEAAA